MEANLHLELVKLQEELVKLKNAVEYIESAKHTTEVAVNLIKKINQLNDSFTKLSEKNEKLVAKIDKVDFPERLDRMETSLNSLNSNLTNLHIKFDLNERNIKDELRSSITKLLNDLDKNFSQLSTVSNNILQGMKILNSEIDNIKLKSEKYSSQLLFNRWLNIIGYLLTISLLIYILLTK